MIFPTLITLFSYLCLYLYFIKHFFFSYYLSFPFACRAFGEIGYFNESIANLSNIGPEGIGTYPLVLRKFWCIQFTISIEFVSKTLFRLSGFLCNNIWHYCNKGTNLLCFYFIILNTQILYFRTQRKKIRTL